MDFEKFVENNIVQYLDKKAGEIADQANLLREEEFSMFEITADYAKEINQALKEGNSVKAKQILEDVRNKYLQAAEGTISKRRLYAILEEVYEKIKDFEEGSGEKSLIETVREYEQKGLFAKPELFKKNESQSLGIIISNITSKEKAIEDLIVKDNPAPANIAHAARIYNELKELIKRIPQDHEDLKGKASERALNQYNLIKKAKENFKKPQAALDAQREVDHLEDKLALIRSMKEDIVKSHNKINECIANKNIVGCIKEYHTLKKLCHSFPRDLPEERLALLAEALSVYEKIKTIKDQYEPKKVQSNNNQPVQDEISIRTDKKINMDERKLVDAQVIDPLQKIKDDISISEKVIDEFIIQKNIVGAMKEYTHLKMLCKIFPKDPNPQEKVTALAGALSAFEKIKKAKDALDKEKLIQEEKEQAQAEDKAKLNEFRDELSNKIEHVKEFLAQKDSQNALVAYSEMKQFFNTFPDDRIEDKKSLYDMILDAHLDMSLLDKDFKNKSVVQADAKIKEIKEGIESAKALLNSKALDDATHAILELKHKSLMLPSEEFDQKYSVLKEIDDLEHKLLFSKNVNQLDTVGGSLK